MTTWRGSHPKTVAQPPLSLRHATWRPLDSFLLHSLLLFSNRCCFPSVHDSNKGTGLFKVKFGRCLNRDLGINWWWRYTVTFKYVYKILLKSQTLLLTTSKLDGIIVRTQNSKDKSLGVRSSRSSVCYDAVMSFRVTGVNKQLTVDRTTRKPKYELCSFEFMILV